MPHAAKDSTTSTANSDILTNPTSTSSVDHLPSLTDKTFGNNLGSRQHSISISPAPLSPAVAGFTFKDTMDPPSPTSMSRYDEVQPLHSPQDFEAERQRRASRAMSKARIQTYDDHFTYKDHHEVSSITKLRQESPVIAELRTNVIVKDEYSLVTELSSHISTRFQRPETCIMITVTHTACLMLGGSFEPAYLLSISAIESFTQSSTNKRNAALVQAFLSEILSVPADRGIVRFTPIREDCLATNGRTIQGEIDKIEGDGGIKKALSKDRRKSTLSMRSRSNSTASKPPDLPINKEEKKKDKEEKKKDKRKSFMSITGRRNTVAAEESGRKSISKRRVSLHPPTNMNGSPPSSSGSSTPAVPSTVYLDVGKDGKQRAVSPSKLDPTASLLNQASHRLSQMSTVSSHSAMHSPATLMSPNSVKSSGHESDNSKKAKKAQHIAQLAGRQPQRSRQQSLPQPPTNPGRDEQPLLPKHSNNSTSNLPAAANSRRSQHPNGALPTPPKPQFSNSSRPSSANKSKTNLNKALPMDHPPPPPEPVSQTPKLSKRKSFIALFKRSDGVKAS